MSACMNRADGARSIFKIRNKNNKIAALQKLTAIIRPGIISKENIEKILVKEQTILAGY